MSDLVFVLAAPFALLGLVWVFGNVLMLAASICPIQPCVHGGGAESIDPVFMDKMLRTGLKVGAVFALAVAPFAFLLL